MIREIKFRGKRLGAPHEWLIGDLNHIDGKVFIFQRTENTPYNSPDWFEVKPETVGQYTGLKDKNGVEIYEGDILDFKLPVNGPDGEEDFMPITVTIDFHGGAFWFNGDGYTDCNWHFYNSEDRVVIGNIHTPTQ